MKVWIDGDGCPVVNIAARLCRKSHTECTILCDTAHEIRVEGAETVVVDKGSDSVDYVIANRVCSGDLVITQDYGLAAMCLSRGGRVIHQDGWEYTPDNIEALLLVRHDSRKYRASGGRMKGMKKRSRDQDLKFEAALAGLLQNTSQG